MKTDKLTKRDIDTLEFIKDYMLEHNVTPSIREICAGLHITSISSAFNHFNRLRDFGYIIPHGNNTTRYSVKGIKMMEVSDEN